MIRQTVKCIENYTKEYADLKTERQKNCLQYNTKIYIHFTMTTLYCNMDIVIYIVIWKKIFLVITVLC